jgi:hypothetical protein
MKKCTMCGEEKDLKEFYKQAEGRNGRRSKCKACISVKCRQYYLKNRERTAEVRRKYRQTVAGKNSLKRSFENNRDKNKLKHIARHAINDEIRIGRARRQPCDVCGNPKSQAHHDNYSKPLDVRWLCNECHLNVHGKGIVLKLDDFCKEKEVRG